MKAMRRYWWVAVITVVVGAPMLVLAQIPRGPGWLSAWKLTPPRYWPYFEHHVNKSGVSIQQWDAFGIVQVYSLYTPPGRLTLTPVSRVHIPTP